jgi:hypothetical protein
MATAAAGMRLFADNDNEVYLQFVLHLYCAPSGAHRVYPKLRLSDPGLSDIGTAVVVHIYRNRASLSA